MNSSSLKIAILGCGARGRLFRGPHALPPGLDGLAGHRLAFLAEKSRIQGGIPCSPGAVAPR